MTDNSRYHSLLLNCGLALAYFFAGKLGQILAIPPGTITVLWPPSGIAVAAILLRGNSLLPGIFIGALLVNLANPLTAMVLVSGLCIGVGSALQAYLIVMLLTLLKIRSNPFEDLSTIVGFVLVAITGSIVSATVGVLSLGATGLLNAQFVFTWSTWWLGDALGILAFTPAIFIPLRERLSGARKSLIYLTLIMSGIAFLTMLVSIFLAYRAYVDAERTRLQDMAYMQASMIDAVARFDARLSGDALAGDAEQATLTQIQQAFANALSAGSERELLIAQEVDGDIVWVASRRTPLEDLPVNIPLDAGVAEPMTLALSGLSGSLSGIDFNGQLVLAAYTHLDALDMGLVVSTLYSELRQPFIVAAALVIFITFFLVLAGTVAFRRVSQPIVGILERKSRELEMLVSEQTQHLKQSEAEFRQLVESAPDAMVIVDRNGIIQLCNHQCETLTGFGRSEIIGQPIEALVPAGRRTHHERFRNQYMRAPQVRQLDRGKGLYCLKKDGSEFPVDIALSPIGSERSSLIAASFRDVTERNAYEDMLKKNEARLQEAFRAGNMEAWELDAASGQVQSSLLLYEKFGYAAVKETKRDDPWLKAIHPEDRDRVSESLDAVRDGTQETYHETYRVYDANEGIRWIESTGKPLKNEQTQKVISIVGIRMDITEQIESRNFLNEKLKELEEFNKLAVGRELRMIELKKEINELRSNLGITDRYEIVE